MRIVVDASVVVAALMADGTVRDVLLSSSDHDFVAPEYIRGEVSRNIPKISRRSRLAPATVRALIEDVFEVLELIPASFYAEWRRTAAEAALRAGAHGDEEYIALAISFDCPIWTLDDDFERIPGLSVLTTRKVIEL
jgi:predicted nucleic acid-binding protein